MSMKLKHSALLLSISVATIVTPSTAQDKKYPEPEVMTPGATEFWLPQPRIVTTDATERSVVAAPSDAIVLFVGDKLDRWQHVASGEAAQWVVDNGNFTIKPGTGDIRTKESFGDCQLHIEWRSPSVVVGQSQGRGNSGVFLQERYEVQILDNYQNETYANGQAGSIYKQHPPLINATLAPGAWNVYDIIFTAPRFKEDGSLQSYATITILHNGVVVQNNATILGPTTYVGVPRYSTHAAKAPIVLQDHSNPVSFRNIWIREL